MIAKFIYKGYQLAPITTRNEDGSYQARVAIMRVGAERPRSQRFVDFEAFRDPVEADKRAIEGGKVWIEHQIRLAVTSFPTDFATLI